jgi:hypothetical protein
MQIYRPNVYPIPMPTPDEMAGLLAISRAALFPRAKPLGTYEGRELFESFAVAFQYVSTLRRSSELKHRADVWIDRCENWAFERHSEYVGVGLSAFLCGVVAAGDVPYRFDPARWPYDIFVGLAWNDGLAATAEGWRGVLGTKKILASTPAPKSPYRDAPHPMIWRA